MDSTGSKDTIDRLRVRVDDEERLAALRSYRILDTDPEAEYERLVAMVDGCCHGAWTAVSFVDRERQWFKARRGFDIAETARSASFCSVAMQQNEPLIVENTLLDARFRDSALVKEYGLRFFAGFPLFSSEGYGLGTVCIMDKRPRTLTQVQLGTIEKARDWVKADLERRRSAFEWKGGAECTTAEQRTAGEQLQLLKMFVAEKAWEAVTAAAELGVALQGKRAV